MTSLTHLPLSMSNACLLRGKKDILIDTGSPHDLPLLKKKLQTLGVNPASLGLIILTHVHFDHAGTAAALRQLAQCPIAVHRFDKPYLESGKNAPIVPVHPIAALMTPFMQLPFSPVKADIILEDAFDLTPFGVDAQIIFTPGHTPGSISVLTASGEAIVGDLVGGGLALGQFQPEKPRYHYWATSMDEVRASLKTLFTHKISKMYVGHGGPLDGEQARKFFLG